MHASAQADSSMAEPKEYGPSKALLGMDIDQLAKQLMAEGSRSPISGTITSSCMIRQMVPACLPACLPAFINQARDMVNW